MRVIGIDPGIERTGFAVMEMRGGKFTLLDCGCIFTDKKFPFAQRLNNIANDLELILRKWKPSAASMEEVFFSKNVKTAIKVSHSRGVILEMLEDHGIPIREFNPSHIKLAVTGHGKAEKSQIKKMLQYLLGINLKSDDASDAIACSICLLTTNETLERR